MLSVIYNSGPRCVPFLLGLTGNIACGKSSVGQLLASRYAAEYVDTDRLVHALYAPDQLRDLHLAVVLPEEG